MISQETIDEIFAAAKIEEVINDFVPLKKKGVNYIGNCPFHNEKTPSFSVSTTKGIFKCFGCGVGGTMVKFIMDIEHYSYPEALKFIAKKYNIEIVEENLSSEQVQKQSKKESLYVISSFANKIFQKTLWETQEGKTVALNYFKERGFTDQSIKKFELGYNTKEKNGISKKAIKNGFDKNLLVESGISILNNKTQETSDRFRERIIFPIHSFSGRVLGFGARAFNANAKAKYLNSPESVIYYKSKVLYGLFQAKSKISKEDNCFIVEGYTDVIRMHQNGIQNVVAASGTALSVEQLHLITRITKNITLLFDGDGAGIKATYRTINLALKEGLNVTVVVFPKGEDPDSYSKKISQDEYCSFIKNEALSFIDYKMMISKLSEQKDPREIVKIKRDIFVSIAHISDALIRAQYCKTYHKKLDINEETMLKEVARARLQVNHNEESFEKSVNHTTIKKEGSIKNQKVASEKLISFEKEVLRILLNYGNDHFVFQDEEITVAGMILTDLSADKIAIVNPLFKKTYLEIEEMIVEKGKINLSYFINHNDEKISQLAVDLISSRYSISENWEEKHNIFTGRENQKMRKTTEKTILSLKKCHIDLQISQLQKQVKEGDVKTSDLQKLSRLTKLKTQIAKILGRNVG